MKAEKTRHLINEIDYLTCGFVSQLKNREVAIRHIFSAEKELSELERIATEYEANKHYIELGKAVEKAFEEGFSINQLHSVLSNVVYCLYDIESLLNWAEGRDND